MRALRSHDDMSDREDWYERRLVEETGKLRVEMAGTEIRLTERIAALDARVVERLAAVEVRLTERIAAVETTLHQEMAGLRVEMAGLRVEMAGLGGETAASQAKMLKWAFVFWTGQLMAMAALLIALR